MWTRAELKNRAKMCLSRYYWAAFAVSLIFGDPQRIRRIECRSTQRITSYLEQKCRRKQPGMTRCGFLIGELEATAASVEVPRVVLPSGIELVPGLGDAYGPGAGNAGPWLRATCFTVFSRERWVVIVIVSVVIGIFVQPLLKSDGTGSIWMPWTGQSGGCRKIFWGFSNGYLKNRGITQFLRD